MDKISFQKRIIPYKILFLLFLPTVFLLNVINISVVCAETNCSTSEWDSVVTSEEYKYLPFDEKWEFIENYRYYCVKACWGWKTIRNSSELYKDITYEKKMEVRKFWFENCVLNSNEYKGSSVSKQNMIKIEWIWLGLSENDFFLYSKETASIQMKYTRLFDDSINDYHSCVEKAANGAITDVAFKVLNRICITKRNERKYKLSEERFIELRKIKNMYFPNGIPH